MKLVNKAMTKSKLERLSGPLPVGRWLTDLAPSFLTQSDLLQLACEHAVLATPLDGVDSSSETRTGRVFLGPGGMRRSLLRFEGEASGGKFTLGAPGDKTSYGIDWELSVQFSESAVSTTVSRYRTLEGKLHNGGTLERLHLILADVLANGVSFAVGDGMPQLAGLLSPRSLPAASFSRTKSSFAGDCLLPLPDAFGREQSIVLGDQVAEDAARAFDKYPYPTTAVEGAIRAIDLSGGGPTAGHIALFEVGGCATLELQIGTWGARSDAERTFRAAMVILRLLSRAIESAHPAASESIVAFLRECLAAHYKNDRRAYFQPVWNDKVVLNVLPAESGRLPLAMTIRSSVALSNDVMFLASSWLQVFQQDRITHYTVRRPVRIKTDGGTAAYFRYVQDLNFGVEQFIVSEASPLWFWQVQVRVTGPVDGVWEVVVMVDGLSKGDGVIGYGGELLAFLRSIAWFCERRDPDCQVRTLTMTS